MIKLFAVAAFAFAFADMSAQGYDAERTARPPGTI